MTIRKVINSIVKSAQDTRVYRGLELSNGLKVVVISDPSTDKSAASLDVTVGNLSDPKDLPGLAHFLEHMLFMGTQKYPGEADYRNFLGQHGGRSNASTSLNNTNYYFDVDPEFLTPTIDMFSQFFKEPLFMESATEREIKAVNSEHEKNLKNDARRLNMLNKATSDPNHDYNHFGTGNTLTLDIIPKQLNLNIRDELLKFHKQWYSANLMALVVLGKDSLDELSQLVDDNFSQIENRNVEAPHWPVHPFGPEQLKQIALVVPIKDIRSLKITFPLPDLVHHYRSDPSYYVGHLIGHEGPGGLLSVLKKNGWANVIQAGYSHGAPGFAFFIIHTDLTEEGIDHYEEIVLLIFQFLEMLQRVGPQEHLFKECQELLAMFFRFKDTEHPQAYVNKLSDKLHRYPMEEVISSGYLLDEFKPKLIQELLAQLVPDTIRIALVGKKFSGMVDSKEKWYGTEYLLSPIPEETLQKWRNPGSSDDFVLPKRNEFIPTNFELTPREKLNPPFPTVILNTPHIRVWYKQDDEFLKPKAAIRFEMMNPLVYSSPQHHTAAILLSMLFEDSFNEYSFDAALAGLSHSFSAGRYGFTLSLLGYNEKLDILLRKIVETLMDFTVDPKRFEIQKERYARALANFQTKTPLEHCAYYINMLLTEKVWSNQQMLDVLDEVTASFLQDIIPKFFSDLHMEVLAHGNLTQKQVFELVKVMERSPWNPLVPDQLLHSRHHYLGDTCNYLLEFENNVQPVSGIKTYFVCGVQGPRTNAMVSLFSQIIRDPCFNMLRTQEQLGYIVHSGARLSSGVIGIQILVQSDRHPSYLDSRIESFLYSMDAFLNEMSEEEFNNHKSSLTSKRLEKPKKMFQLFGKFWNEIGSKHYNFDRDNIEMTALSHITKDELYEFYKELIAHDGPLRKKVSVHVISTIPLENQQENETLDLPPDLKLENPEKIENIEKMKNSLGFYPLPPPWEDVQPMLNQIKTAYD